MKKIYLILTALICTLSVFAQVTVTGDGAGGSPYATLADAINAVNAVGTLTQPTTISTSISETAPSGGYQITAIGSAANTLIISGGDNTITAFGGQTAGSLTDAIFKIIGGDYITIQRFVIVENAANSTTAAATNNMTEWGIALLYASSTNGAQNNVIQNNNISLNRLYQNTFAIYSNVRHTSGNATTSAEVATTIAGSNSFNRVYSNLISNVNYGIVFVGAVTTLAAIDNGNDIGGTSLTTGNTLTNWGGIGVAISSFISVTGANSGIVMHQQINDNISYNTITSFAAGASGTMVGTTLNGIAKTYAATPTGTITSNITFNTITVTSAPTTGFVQGVSSTGLTAQATSTLNINNNNIINCAITGAAATTGALVGITNTSAFGTLNINSNIISGGNRTGTTGQVQGISNSGAIVNTLNINGNQFGTATADYVTTSTATSGTVFGISTSGGAATCNTTIQNNDIRRIVHSVAATSLHAYITSTGAVLTNTINNNTFTNLNVNTTGSVTFVNHNYSMPANGTQTFDNNRIVTGFSKTGAGGTITGFTSGGSSPNSATYTVINNNLSNITVAGATAITGITNSDGAGTSPNRTVTGNIFNNWTGGSSAIIGMTFNYIGATSSLSNNTLTNFTGTSSILGLNVNSTFNGGNPLIISNNIINNFTSSGAGGAVTGLACSNTSPVINIISNQINTLSSTGAATVSGITISGSNAAGTNVSKNNIYNLSNSNANPIVNGITLSGGTLTNAFNNFISDLRAPNASAAVPIYGINNTGGTNVGIYYNTIALGKAATLTSGGTQFGATGIGYSSSTNVTLRNNIVWIDATPIGTGTIAAVRRSAPGTAGTAPSTSNFNSNNNIYYVVTATGTSPVLANLNKYLYLEGTVTTTATNGFGVEIGQVDNATLNLRNDLNFNTACGLYKTFMGAREGGTFTEDNLVAGGGSTFSPAGSSFASNSAQVISTPSIVDDYNSVARSTTTPDMGALEFAGVSVDATPPVINYTVIPNLTCTAAPVLAATITDASGVNTSAGLAPRLYFRKGGAVAENDVFLNYPSENTSAFNGWKYVEATGTAPNFSFALDYGLLSSPIASGDSITYFVLAQDLATVPNVGKNTVTFPTTFCPSSVNVPSTGAMPTAGSMGYRIVALSATKADGNAATAIASGTTNVTFVQSTINGNAACLSTVTQVDFTVSGTAPSADIAAAKCFYTTTAVFNILTATPFGAVIPTPSAGGISFVGSQNLAVGANYFWLVYDIACNATVANTVNGDITGITVNSNLIVPTGTAPVANAIVAPATFITVADGEWSNTATWACGNVPPTNATAVTIAHNITVSDGGNIGGSVTINSGRSLTINPGGELILGTIGGGNRLLTNNGTLAVTGGTLTQNGNIVTNAGSIFNQSAGSVVVDGNANGVAGNSVASGTVLFSLRSNLGSVTGGNLTFVDPPVSGTARTFEMNFATAGMYAVWGVNHSLIMGDGASADPSTNTVGFAIDTYVGTASTQSMIGRLVVNGGSGTNRFASVTSSTVNGTYVNGDIRILSGSELRQATSGTFLLLNGSMINDGTFTNVGSFVLGTFSTNLFVPSTNSQIIGGSGIFRNAITSPTANISVMEVNNSNSTGVTLGAPLAISGTLFMDAGIINTDPTNILTLGYNATNAGTLTYIAGHIKGPFTRWITAATGVRQFPMGNGISVKNANINFTTAPTTAGTLTAEWKNTPPAAPQPALTEGALIVNKASDQGSWLIDATTLDGGVYTGTFTANGSTDVVDFARTVLIKRPSSGGAWVLDGTHVTSTGSNTAPVLSRTGMVGFSEFAIGGEANIVLPLNLIYFTGVKQADGNKLDWKVTCIGSPSVVLTIERSGDGRRFSPIYNLSATALRCETPFDFKDLNPSTGVNYYRLKMVDIDGRVSYSPIVVIINKGAGIEIVNVYPNPVRDAATLSIASAKQASVEVRVSDLSGRTVLTRKVSLTSGTNNIPLNLANLSGGTYLVTVAAEGEVLKTTKIIKD